MEYTRLTTIQCDRKLPSCSQCERLGVECAGYARERVFVNTTKEPSQSIVVSTNNRRSRPARATPDSQYLKLSWSSYLPNGQPPSLHEAKARAATWTSPMQSLYPKNIALGACLDSSAAEGRQRLERELMHRWMTSSYMSLCCLPEDGPWLQIELPRWAMAHGFLTDGIFALALLEGVLRRDSSHSPASQAQFVRVAMEYYDTSSAAFREQLRCVTPDNIHIMYVYSCITVIVNMALFQCRYNEGNDTLQSTGMLQHVTGLMELFIGCSWLAVQHIDWMRKSPLGPLVDRADSHWIPASVKPIEGPVDIALTRLMCAVNNSASIVDGHEEDPAVTRLNICRKAVTHLRRCFAVSIHSEMRGFCGEFPSLAGRNFVQYVKEGDPIALFIMLHWAVLLQYVDNWAWWAGSFGRVLVYEISDVLTVTYPELVASPEWGDNIAWAKDEVSAPSSYKPLTQLSP
jgi:hypothetical protein